MWARLGVREGTMGELAAAVPQGTISAERLLVLQAIEKKLLWLSSWTIHNANHLRPSRDKLKVGGSKIKDLHRHTQLAVKNGEPSG